MTSHGSGCGDDGYGRWSIANAVTGMGILKYVCMHIIHDIGPHRGYRESRELDRVDAMQVLLCLIKKNGKSLRFCCLIMVLIHVL